MIKNYSNEILVFLNIQLSHIFQSALVFSKIIFKSIKINEKINMDFGLYTKLDWYI